MISFRYHLVSIVAVFLALGLGVLAGTTVIDQQLVDGLRAQIEDANAEVGALREQADGTGAVLERQTRLVDELVPQLEAGQLTGQEVIIVASEGTDPAVLTEARASLSDAGAEVVAGFVVTPRMVTSAGRRDLAELLGIQDPGSTGSPQEAASVIAERLARGDTSARDDILHDLLSQGFLVPAGKEDIGASDLPQIGGSGQSVVVLGSGGDDPLVQAFLLPLTIDLVKDGATVAAGESSSQTDQLVGLLRSNGELDDRSVTVDNLNERVGGLALVLGLRDLLATGRGEHFGFKPGASALYPPPEG
ncbi:MAG: copper transporter [Actinomycetota bacterium]